MTISIGSRLGPYEVLSPLGAGGMGEVYKARDTRLERTVAIKVLPSNLSSSEQVRQRFEREAKTISQLSHPHICALYDVGNQDGVEYLVMELLEGETLADRLLKGALPTEHTLRFGIEIADALDKAHRQGIVHRDLKPGNVMLTKSGVKLLDFGLAKALPSPGGRGAGGQELTSLPTMANAPLTQEGTILGTFQYMAPEQLEGKETDARTDIFAFGAVLYEMATGRKAFAGSSQASLISAIMKEEPAPIAILQPMTPPAFDRVVRTCLAKDPEDRWQSARDVASELKWIAQAGSQAGVPVPVVSRRRSHELIAWTTAAIFALAAVVAVQFARGRREAADLHPIHALIPMPEKASFQLVAVPEVSPDGRTIVWSGSDASAFPTTSPLWVRSMGSDDPRPLAGTERAMYAFWSPDSRSIGFFADRKLKRVDLAGGVPVTLCEISDIGRGGSWSPDGTIIFSGARTGPLFRVSANGGTPEPLTKLDAARGDTTHRWPHFLPDGRRFLYLASPNVSEKRTVFLASLDGRENRPLALAPDVPLAASESGHPARTEAVANAVYASGRVLFIQRSTLYARPFDASRGEITGPAVAVAENVASGFGIIRSMFSASRGGELVFVAEPTNLDNRIEWISRDGQRSPALAEALVYAQPRLSPDGKRLAVVVSDSPARQADIWTMDLERGSRTRLTFGPGSSQDPVWSPDGTRIAYVAPRPKLGIFEKSSGGIGSERLLLETEGDPHLESWSPDGRFLLYSIWNSSRGTRDLLALPLSPPGKPIPYLRTVVVNDTPEAIFSPDGKHVTYTSTESGRDEVYVQTFPAGEGKWQISTQGGSSPRWRRDGKEIFFLDPDKRILSVSARTEPAFEAGTPHLAAEPPANFSSYDAAPEGERFLVCSRVVDPASLPQHLIVHWTAGLSK